MNQNFLPFLPEFILTGGLLLLIVLDLVIAKRKGVSMAIGGTLLLTIVAIAALTADANVGPYLFNSVVQDGVTVYFRVLFAMATMLSLGLLVMSFPDEGEPFLLMLSSVLGMMLLAGANDLVTLFIALELVSIPSYVLAGYKRKDVRSGEAALKYVLYGAVSSGLMVYGFSLLYGLTGQTNIPNIVAALTQGGLPGAPLVIALLMVLAGLGYKVAMVPFHFWCPDVYEGSPTAITAFFSVTPKAAGFAALYRLFPIYLTLAGMGQAAGVLQSFTAVGIFTLMSAVTMTFGNLGALWQDSLKRLLAYSSIAHAGYILMGFAAMAALPSGEPRQIAEMSVLFYLCVYLFMNLGAFFVVDLIERKEGSEKLAAIKGWGRKHPVPSLLLAVFLFSLTGLPPLAGFVGKFYLMAAVIKGNLISLAVIAGANTAISLYYYVRIIRDMFLFDPEGDAAPAGVTPRLVVALGVATLVPTLVLGVAFGSLADWITRCVM